jgi:hypothetical protein
VSQNYGKAAHALIPYHADLDALVVSRRADHRGQAAGRKVNVADHCMRRFKNLPRCERDLLAMKFK